MGNTDTQETLGTRHRTKTYKTNNTAHQTNKRATRILPRQIRR
jgi:hypothetical protein